MYLGGLQHRSKLRAKWDNSTVGSIITVFDPLRPKYWPLAIVTAVKKGKDKLVGTVTYKMSNQKEYQRDIQYVSLLLQNDKGSDHQNALLDCLPDCILPFIMLNDHLSASVFLVCNTMHPTPWVD